MADQSLSFGPFQLFPARALLLHGGAAVRFKATALAEEELMRCGGVSLLDLTRAYANERLAASADGGDSRRRYLAYG